MAVKVAMAVEEEFERVRFYGLGMGRDLRCLWLCCVLCCFPDRSLA